MIYWQILTKPVLCHWRNNQNMHILCTLHPIRPLLRMKKLWHWFVAARLPWEAKGIHVVFEHGWRHCLTDFELSTQSSGTGRCVACLPETGNISLLWLKSFQLYLFFWIWYDLASCIVSTLVQMDAHPKEIGLAQKFLRRTSLFASCSSADLHLLALVHDRFLSPSLCMTWHFLPFPGNVSPMTEDSTVFSRLPSVPFLPVHPALGAHPETSAIQTVPGRIICWDSDQLLLCFCHGLCNGFLSQKKNKSSKWGFYGFGIFKLWNLKNGRNKSVCKIRPYRISAKSPCLWILQAACWEFRSRLLDLRNNASP